MSKGAQIAIGAVVVVLLLGWYAATSLGRGATFRYYQTLSEFRSAGSPDSLARVHGYVVPGSIQRDLERKQVRFAIQNDAPHAGGGSDLALPVIYSSLETPDLFKDGAEVVVEGKLTRGPQGTVFQAENVLAKCPSKFRAQRTEPASF